MKPTIGNPVPGNAQRQRPANSLGQAGGPLLGGALFIWQTNAPYLFSGAVLLALALVIGWKAADRQREAKLA